MNFEQTYQHISEPVKHVIDASAIVTAIATMASWLPSLASLFTILWMAIRIWETKTVRNMFRK